MSISGKTRVVEYLFSQRWNEATRSLTNPLVTLEDVTEAIRECKAKLSTRNPANFFKDLVRNKKSANRNWPRTVLRQGYAARQVTGENRCFEFVLLRAGATEPFPNALTVPSSLLKTPHRIESVSLPTASRRLGRSDEPWLVQVAVRLRVIETHFALFSERPVIQVDHLQMSVKLQKAEIDALFLLQEGDPLTGQIGRSILVCCEAKGAKDDILEDQIVSQVQSVAGKLDIQQEIIVPVALKVVGDSLVYLVEFQEVSRADAGELQTLTPASQMVYRITPPVPGIGATPSRPKPERGVGRKTYSNQ